MFFTTIKLIDGKAELLNLHLERMSQTRNVYFKTEQEWNLEIVHEEIAKHPKGLFRLRIDYDTQIRTLTVTPYSIKLHQKLKLIDAGEFSYAFKTADRVFFENSLQQNPECDDILFFKNGNLTDTTYCNLALFDGYNWFTPKTHLLAGVKRKSLIKSGLLKEADITLNNLKNYQKIAFINAMRDFEITYTFTVSNQTLMLFPANNEL